MVSLITGHDCDIFKIKKYTIHYSKKKDVSKLNFLWNSFQRHCSLHLIGGEIDTKVLNKVYKHKVIIFRKYRIFVGIFVCTLFGIVKAIWSNDFEHTPMVDFAYITKLVIDNIVIINAKAFQHPKIIKVNIWFTFVKYILTVLINNA